jgi:hypothetical protein
MIRKMSRATVLVVCGLVSAGLAVAGCGSSDGGSGSTSGPAAARTGTQVVAGSVTGRAALASQTTIPLKLSGVVTTTGSIRLVNSRNQPTIMIRSGMGNLAVSHSKGKTTQKLLSSKTCKIAYGVRGTYKVEGGKSTGTFKGASGSGRISLLFTANLPRKSDGTCNISSSAVPRASSARVTFAARGPMTVR